MQYTLNGCPNKDRLNYILWLQDLLDTTGDEFRDDFEPDRDVVGLDMYIPIAPSSSLC